MKSRRKEIRIALPNTPHRGSFRCRKSQSNRALSTYLIKPPKKWQENIQFIRLFRDVLTEKRKWFKFLPNGEIIEIDEDNVQPIGIKTIKIGKEAHFMKSINTLYTEKTFEIAMKKILPIHLQSFKLPVFDRYFRVMSIKDYFKNRPRKEVLTADVIENRLLTYDALRMDCKASDKKTEEEKGRTIREKLAKNLTGIKYKPIVIKQKPEVNFRRSNAKFKAETYSTRCEKKKCCIPDYSNVYTGTERQ